MLIAGCGAILATSEYQPPTIEDTRQHELSDTATAGVTVRLSQAAREQAGAWSIKISARIEGGGELTITPERGPLGLKKDVTIGVPPTGSADEDSGAAGAGSTVPQSQSVERELRPDVADCPEHRECEVKFNVARSDARTGAVSLTVHSSAHRPLEDGCMGSTAPEFTPDAKLVVVLDE